MKVSEKEVQEFSRMLRGIATLAADDCGLINQKGHGFDDETFLAFLNRMEQILKECLSEH